MRKILLCLSLMISVMMYAETSTGVRIIPVSGAEVTFLFSEEPEISFLGSSLNVTTNVMDEPVSFEIDNIDSIDFIKGSEVNAPTAKSGIKMRVNANSIIFEGIDDNTPAAVYTADGKIVLSKNVSGQLILNKANLGKQVYIVRIGNFVTKISM